MAEMFRTTAERTVALGTALALLLSACADSNQPASSERPARRLLPASRLELPEFGLGRFQALLQELSGTPVVVNIWGSWCPPCRLEAPGLATVSREFGGRIQFLGVDILDSRPAARQFILEFDWQYPSVFDPEAEIRDGLGYFGQPVTLIFDPDGRKTFEWAGPLTEEILRREIRKVLASKES
ncbi:MAG: TlpA family protein disulfide reductase [Actinomycetota bacterium]